MTHINCSGITKKKTQCKNRGKYIVNDKYYCHLHYPKQLDPVSWSLHIDCPEKGNHINNWLKDIMIDNLSSVESSISVLLYVSGESS